MKRNPRILILCSAVHRRLDSMDEPNSGPCSRQHRLTFTIEQARRRWQSARAPNHSFPLDSKADDLSDQSAYVSRCNSVGVPA